MTLTAMQTLLAKSKQVLEFKIKNPGNFYPGFLLAYYRIKSLFVFLSDFSIFAPLILKVL